MKYFKPYSDEFKMDSTFASGESVTEPFKVPSTKQTVQNLIVSGSKLEMSRLFDFEPGKPIDSELIGLVTRCRNATELDEISAIKREYSYYVNCHQSVPSESVSDSIEADEKTVDNIDVKG